MTENFISFPEEIEHNQSETEVPTETVELSKGKSALNVRLRGCFITNLNLTNPITGEETSILNSEQDKTKAKLTASHIMSPIGKYEGIGGQHGFARWADYHEFPLLDGENGEKRVSFQAKRSDMGLGLYKYCELHDNCLISNTVFSTTTKTEQALKKKITALEKEITKLKADLKKANTKINNLLAKIKQCLKWPKKK